MRNKITQGELIITVSLGLTLTIGGFFWRTTAITIVSIIGFYRLLDYIKLKEIAVEAKGE